MIKKLFFFCVLIFFPLSQSFCFAQSPQIQNMQQLITSFSNTKEVGITVEQSVLPFPYSNLLTQALMTKGIEKYYQRRPIIKTIYVERNKNNNSYFRVILMLLDKNFARNKPDLAQKKGETIVAELAFITMNFNELPNELITEVLNSNIPFGQLLLTHHVNTYSADRRYFSLSCTEALSSLLHCNLKSTLYGRTNTLVRTDNKRWVARVLEILR